uniref:hypothetical protein n=1 Tax=Dysgonomonas sp. ZJ279 TaxID=2709796 RepID=UPI00293B9CF5
RNVQFSRFCQFGSGTGAIAWSSLTRLNSLLAISNHVNRVDNPHGVTKTQVGLGNLPNAKTDDPAVNDTNILATSKAVATHVLNKSNPHAVTKTHVGLGNLPNAKTDDPAVNDTNILATSKAVATHVLNKSNPHAVTKTQVGLGNLPNAKTDDPAVSNSEVLATSKMVSTATAGVLSIFQQGFVELVYNQPAPRININKQLALGKIGVIANIYAYQKTDDTYSDLYFNTKEHLLSAVSFRFSNATGMAESVRIGFDTTQTNASTKYYLEYMIYQKP